MHKSTANFLALSLSTLFFVQNQIAVSTLPQDRDEFLQYLFCQHGDLEYDLPQESSARDDYETIRSRSTSWCSWLGIGTPSPEDEVDAIQDFITDRSQELTLTHTNSEYLATLVSLLVQAQLYKQLYHYEYPDRFQKKLPPGALRKFLGHELEQGIIRTLRDTINPRKIRTKKNKRGVKKPITSSSSCPNCTTSKQPNGFSCTITPELLAHLMD